jgi:hypothetical protein
MSVTESINNRLVNPIRTKFNHFNRRVEDAKINAENQLWWNNYSRLISPDKIVVNEDYMEVDGMLVESIIVGLPQLTTDGYPGSVKPDFLEKLMDVGVEGVVISISFGVVPIPTHEAQLMLQDAMFRNKVNQNNTQKGNELGMNAIVQQLDARDMATTIEKLHNNEEKLCNTAYIITIWAEDARAMRQAKSRIKVVLNSHRVYGSYPSRKMLETYRAAQGYPNFEEYTFVPMVSSFAGSLCPTKNPEGSLSGSTKGLLMGIDRKGGQEIVVDLEARANQHMLLAGGSGSGKTYLMLGLLGRLYTSGRHVVYITVKDDGQTRYLDMANYFSPDSCIINIGPGKDCKNINPLQIMHSGKGITAIEAASIYDRHKTFVYAFFKTWFKTDLSPNMEAYLDKSLNKVYTRFQIFRNDPKSWMNKDFPVMKDIIRVWRDDKNSKDPEVAESAQALLRKTYFFEEDGTLSYMNRQTNINLEAGFTVIDLVSVPDMIQEAMNAFVTGLMTTYFSTGNKHGVTICVDEGRAFLTDPQLASMVLKILTQGRSYDIGMIFGTQEFEDLEKAKLSAEFMSNVPIKLVLGYELDAKAISYIKDFLLLKNTEVKYLKTQAKGQGIIKIGDANAPYAFIATEKEDAIIKGKYKEESEDNNSAPSDDTTATATEGNAGGKIRDAYLQLAKENKVVYSDWIDGEDVDVTLQRLGYTRYNPQNMLKRGNVICWAHDSLIAEDGSVKVQAGKGSKDNFKNQSQEHYFAVTQLAGILTATSENQKLGFTDVNVHHHNDVDVSAMLGKESYGFEYEHPESHNTDELIEKLKRAKAKYDHVVFIGSKANEAQLKHAVGEHYLRRGDQVKAWLDQNIEEYRRQNENDRPMEEEKDEQSNPEQEPTKEQPVENTVESEPITSTEEAQTITATQKFSPEDYAKFELLAKESNTTTEDFIKVCAMRGFLGMWVDMKKE